VFVAAGAALQVEAIQLFCEGLDSLLIFAAASRPFISALMG
jgi:hypothetical protein